MQAEPLTATFPYVGGFSGWGGLVYTLTHLGRLWAQPALLAQATTWAELAATYVEQDEQLDIIGGAAGCIGAVAALHRVTGEARLLPVIARCADHLLATAQPVGNGNAAGVGWVVPNMGGLPLAGFSHGAAGMAWALDTAAQLCANADYAATAAAARRYEASLFDAAAQNWRDLRREEGDAPVDPATAPAGMWAWCHGAPGIGLARLSRYAATDDPAQRADLTREIRAALASTTAHGFGHGHSLCHGDFGNLDLLVTAATVSGRRGPGRRCVDGAAWLAQARDLAASLLAQQPHTGWVSGVPGGVETPGLMVGLAGIGYELLRLADPARLPSVLLLEPPR